jgi:hypothetical protein
MEHTALSRARYQRIDWKRNRVELKLELTKQNWTSLRQLRPTFGSEAKEDCGIFSTDILKCKETKSFGEWSAKEEVRCEIAFEHKLEAGLASKTRRRGVVCMNHSNSLSIQVGRRGG